MPVTQIISVVGKTPTILGEYTFNGSAYNWGMADSSRYQSYVFPDSSSGFIYNLNGVQYVSTQGLGSQNQLTVNLWFYPLLNSVILMNESNAVDEYGGYHYSTMEINSTSYLRSRTWPTGAGSALTSASPVNLNAWNHVCWSYDSGTGLTVSLNGAAGQNMSVTREQPDNTFLGIGKTDTTNIEPGNNYRYQGYVSDLVVSTSSTASTYLTTKSKYGF